MENEFFPSKRTGFWVLLFLLLGVTAGIFSLVSAISRAALQFNFRACAFTSFGIVSYLDSINPEAAHAAHHTLCALAGWLRAALGLAP